MHNWMLIDSTTGKILNALQTPDDGVGFTPENGQEVLTITADDFAKIFDETYSYYNKSTNTFEPENIRKLSLLTPGPYSVGTVSLQFQQQTLDGTNVVEPTDFTVTLNGQSQTIHVDDGTLEIAFNCPIPKTLKLTISANRYETVDMEVTVQ